MTKKIKKKFQLFKNHKKLPKLFFFSEIRLDFLNLNFVLFFFFQRFILQTMRSEILLTHSTPVPTFIKTATPDKRNFQILMEDYLTPDNRLQEDYKYCRIQDKIVRANKVVHTIPKTSTQRTPAFLLLPSLLCESRKIPTPFPDNGQLCLYIPLLADVIMVHLESERSSHS